MKNDQLLKLATILNTTCDGICIFDDKDTIQFMNLAMVRMFGDRTGDKCYSVVNGQDEICFNSSNAEIPNDSDLACFNSDLSNINDDFESIVVPIRSANSGLLKLGIYRNAVESKSYSSKYKLYGNDYKSIFEHVAVGVFISSKEGKFIDANSALLDMLKYENKAKFLGLDLVQDLYLRPEERTEFQNMIEAESKVTDYSVMWKCSDNSIVSVLLTAHVRYDNYGEIIGYEGVCVDQTQRLKMERELKETHVFLNQTIQSSPNAIMANDMNGNIIVWNKGAEETFRYASNEVVGKMNVRDLYHSDLAKKVMEMVRSDGYGGKGKLRAYPMTLADKDGQLVEGNLSANIIYDENMKEMASVGIFVDLREQLAMERKLRSTQEQLLHSEKLAAMGRLTSQIAHEINNPLFGIMNTFELLKTEIKPDNKRRKLLDMALSETERLADMLRKMLSFSKPDQEQRSLVDINTILEELLLLHEKQLSEHSVKVFTSMDRSIDKVYASKNQLRQVFLNMISNAKDAMPDGGKITVDTKKERQSVRIEISDNGVGIKKEHFDLIFETFFTTKTDSVKGVGLGLSVCYGFIKDHDGDIKVKSRVGKGTSFVITLPASSYEAPTDSN